MTKPLVSIVMGSDSDLDIMREASGALEDFGIAYEMDVTSAHRSPERTAEYARAGRRARDSRHHRGSGRGGASGRCDCGAYLLPVIGVPIPSTVLARARFPAGDGADAGRNSGGNRCHRQAGGDQRGHFGGTDSGALERGFDQKDGGAQGEAGRRGRAEVAQAEGFARSLRGKQVPRGLGSRIGRGERVSRARAP